MSPDSAFPPTPLQGRYLRACRLIKFSHADASAVNYKKRIAFGLAYAGHTRYALGMEYTITTFTRLGGSETDEFRTAEPLPHTLAYYDRQPSGLVSLTVFDPFTGKSREYASRPAMRARGILYRHLDKLGYKYERTS